MLKAEGQKPPATAAAGPERLGHPHWVLLAVTPLHTLSASNLQTIYPLQNPLQRASAGVTRLHRDNRRIHNIAMLKFSNDCERTGCGQYGAAGALCPHRGRNLRIDVTPMPSVPMRCPATNALATAWS
jgi:hypothetical protein